MEKKVYHHEVSVHFVVVSDRLLKVLLEMVRWSVVGELELVFGCNPSSR